MAPIYQKKHKMLRLAVSKVKMHDSSHQYGNEGEVLEKIKLADTPMKHYPSLYLNDKEAPMLKEYKVGDTCILVIKAKLKSHNSSSSTTGGESHNYTLEVQSIGKGDGDETEVK